MGQLKIAIIGDGYTNRSEAHFFLSDVEIAKRSLLIRPPFKQRALQIAFTVLNGDNRFRCGVPKGTAPGAEVLICNIPKIAEALEPNVYDIILVLVNKQGSGSSEGQLAIVGVGNHVDPEDEKGIDGKVSHEIGHIFTGEGHVLLFGGIMGSMTNGGRDAYTQTFIPAHQDLINQKLDQAAGGFATTEVPIVTITQATKVNENQVLVRATVANDAAVMKVATYLDNVLASEHIYWDRNPSASTATGIRAFTPAPPGTHTIKVVVTDVTYKQFSTSKPITI